MFISSYELSNLEHNEKIETLRFAWMFGDMDRLTRSQRRERISHLLVKFAGILIDAGTSLKARAERSGINTSHSVPSFQGR